MEELEKEEETQEEIEKRKLALKNHLSKLALNKYSLIFIGIFLLGIIIRLSFFLITKNQPLWWDEADYMAYAKNIANVGSSDWIVTSKHNSLFPYIAAIFIKIGSSEAVLKFLLEFLPSVLLIFLTYKICTLMYKDKKIALISSFLMATLWVILFNSFRFHLDIPALFVAFFAFYVFFQGYEKKEKIFGKINPKYTILLTVLLVMLVYAIRKSYFLFGAFFLVYMFSTRSLISLVKDKYNWISLSVVVFLYIILDKFIFLSSLDAASTVSDAFGFQFDLVPLSIFGNYFGNISNTLLSPLTWLFWIGFLLILFNIFIGFKFLRKRFGNEELKADFFNFLCISITLTFFFFLTRDGGLGDARWYFPLILASFISISKGGVFIFDFIKKYNKQAAVIVLILLIGFGGYYEYNHGKAIILNKVDSYSGIKDASLYLKETSNLEDVIISVPVPQTAYYSERSSLSPSGLLNEGKPSSEVTLNQFLDKIGEIPEVRYIIVSFSEPGHPEWMRNESAEYIRDQTTGQIMRAKMEIPFMDTKIDFINQIQDIKETKTYGDLTFNLLKTNQDSFIYEIKRS